MGEAVKVPIKIEPYESASEYIYDQLVILDLLLEAEMNAMSQEELRTSERNPFKGMYLTESEAQQILATELTYISLEAEQLELINRLEQMIDSRLQRNRELSIPLSIINLQQRLCLDELDIRLLIVSLAPHMNRKYLKLYGYVQDDLTCQFVTLDLLMRLCSRSREEQKQVYRRMMNASSNLRNLFTTNSTQSFANKDSSVLVEPLVLEPRIIHYLLELNWKYNGLLSKVRYTTQQKYESLLPLMIHESLQQQMINYVKHYHDQPFILLMIGTTGSGKTIHSQHLARKMGRPTLELDTTSLSNDIHLLGQTIELFLQEAKLMNAIPIFDHIEQFTSKNEEKENYTSLQILQEQLQGWHDIIILHSNNHLPLITKYDQIERVIITFPLPTLEEGSNLWRSYAGSKLIINPTLALQLATKFQFTAGQIASTVREASLLKHWSAIDVDHIQLQHEQDDSYWLHQAANGLIHHGLQQKAVQIKSQWDWPDLILPQETLQLLQQACHRVANRHIVMHEWGFERLLPYGRGVSMLFTGPPGTGKTMAALVMAKAMKAELYRVDLTRIVSKYIGETEKNLADVFDRAKLSGAILFFDEADALFGKRSEVKDAHDKYANMETSYLLQKMEEYDGLTILATNFSQNLDDAFMRRIQYIIKFPFPDATQREQLWRSIIPSHIRIEPLDIPFLAKTFELSGGPIKNIVLTAVYLVAQDRSKLSMQHFIEAAIQEYKKTGKLLMKDRLGPYAQYWKG
ncbi:AAA family ATPase [Paenibacillus endoradicis]|uniref:AAA family ATPase n=1 Tax=Paenibacillus endoradicis TaxID=2972487 RepID=UPI002159AB5C|nr:AAA family ATPase [Paenibacillus endoradicis]MCR8657454.1 AAA family ATPase [Paenibacillus endoradicis]